MIEFILSAALVLAFMLAFEPAHRRIRRREPMAYGTDRSRVLAEWQAAVRHFR